jgi:O-antigen/teichoic acid export membrane protein
LVTTLADQLHPLATVYHETGNKAKLQDLLIRGTKYTLLLGVGACVMLGVFAEPITRLWLGRSLGAQYLVTAQVLVFLAAIDLLSHSAGSQGPVLLGANRLRFLTWTQLPLAVLNVGASAALVALTDLGVVGVAIPTLAIMLIRRPITIIHTAHVCGLPASQYLRKAYLRPAAVLAVFAGAAQLLRHIWPIMSLAGLIGTGALLLCVFLGLCWLVGLNVDDKAVLRQLCRTSATILGRREASRE